MSDEKTCTCFKCEKDLPNVADEGLQPMSGTAFRTYGHYGSGVFDPMNGSWLEIAICDECLGSAMTSPAVVGGKPTG